MKFFKIYVYLLSVFFLIAPVSGQTTQANTSQSQDDLLDMSVEDLLNIKISLASKFSELPEYAPGIISIISRKEIDGFASSNLGEVLERVTGTSFLSANNWRNNIISFRGQSLTPYNNHTLILLNGRPLRDPISGGLNSTVFNSFPVSKIDHIEIIRGPGSVLYGSCAFAGIINIVTRGINNNSAKHNITVKAGSNKTYNIQLDNQFTTGKLNLSAGINYLKSDGPEFSFNDNIGVYKSRHFDNKNLGAFLNINYKNLTLNGYYATYDTYALGGGNLDWSKEGNSAGNHKTYFTDLGYELNIGKKVKLNLNFTFNKHDVDAERDDTIKAQSFLFETSSRISVTPKSHLLLGAVLEHEDFYGDLLINRHTTSYSLYFQADHTINKLKFIGGVQFNKIKGINGNFSPRLGLIYNFHPEAGVKVLYSQAFRKGYPLETSFNHPVFRGNLKLEPEETGTLEAQLYYHTKETRLSITFYTSKMWRIVGRQWHIDENNEPYGGYLQYYNKPEELQFVGMELEGRFSITKDLFFTGSFTHQKSKNEAGEQNTTLHPDFTIKAGLLYEKNHISIGIFNSFFSKPHKVEGLTEDRVLNPEAKAYNLLSLKIRYNLPVKSVKRVAITLEATNILNKDIRYPEYTSRQINTLQPLRNGIIIMGGLTISL